MGRLDEGLAQSRKAAELDPLSVGPVHDIAINYMARGDLEQAATNFRRAIDIDPNWTWGYVKLGRTLARQKKCPEALAQAEIAERRIAGGAAPLSRAWLGATYGICGETARARQKLEELHALSQKQYVDPVDLRRHPQQPRRSGRGAALVREGLRGPDAEHGLRVHRAPDQPRLAGNPRYEAILRRMGFPQPGELSRRLRPERVGG